jgi:hypothetical protein
VAVNQMQAKGVEVIFVKDNQVGSGLFSQQADKQAYHPLYLATDHSFMTNDGSAQFFSPGSRMIGLTAYRTGEVRQKVPEPATDAACRARFNAHSSIGPAGYTPSGADVYAQQACGHLNLFQAAATAVGPVLTRAAFMAVLDKLGAFHIPAASDGTFAPGKRDGSDYIRPLQFQGSCSDGSGKPCWMPTGGFIRSQY